METLEYLARILRYTDKTAAQKRLLSDIRHALAIGAPTKQEIADILEEAIRMRIIGAGESFL